MDKIYFYEWTGKNTGWDYRLEFIPASLTPLSEEIQYVRLPVGCIEAKGRKKNFDKYPFGLAEGCTYNFNVYLSEVPETSLYKEFFECIINPIQVVTVPVQFREEVIKNIKGVVIGTMVRIKMKYHGNQEDSNGDWSEPRFIHWEGCIRDNNSVKYNMLENIAEVTATDALKCVLTNFNFSLYRYYLVFNGLLTEAQTEVYNWCSKKNGKSSFAVSSGYVAQSNKEYYKPIKYVFAKLDTIKDYINFVGGIIRAVIYRYQYVGVQHNIDVSMYPPNFYKQLYDGSGGHGDMLERQDLYILAISYVDIDNTTTDLAGLAVSNNEDGLNQRYPNSVWDYLKDYSEYTLTRFDILHSNTLYRSPIFCYRAFGEDEHVLKQEDLIKIEIEQNKNILKKVTSSITETYTGNDFADKDNYEVSSIGTRNEADYTLPVLFNNNPLCLGYKLRGEWSNKKIYKTRKISQSAVYYLDTQVPSMINNQTTTRFVKAHENSFLDLGFDNALLNTPPPNFTPNYFAFDDRANIGADDVAFIVQNAVNGGGLPRYTAAVLLELFSKVNQHVISIEVPYQKYTSFRYGGDSGFVWWHMNSAYEIDWTSFRGFWGSQYKYWRPIEVELDDENEIAILKLYPETINAK